MHVNHEYVCMEPMTDKNIVLYMAMKTLGLDWLKNHRRVIWLSVNKSDIKGQSLCKALNCLIGGVKTSA